MLDGQEETAVVLEQKLLIVSRELDFELGLTLEHLDVELEPRQRRELSRRRRGKIGCSTLRRRKIARLGHEVHRDGFDRPALPSLAAAAAATATAPAALLSARLAVLSALARRRRSRRALTPWIPLTSLPALSTRPALAASALPALTPISLTCLALRRWALLRAVRER
jgi:hypothetical protein